MRTRRFTITAFLLCAIMLLGVGFATITDNFSISGQAKITEDAAEDVLNNEVYFSGIVVDGNLKSDVLSGEGLGYTASINVAEDSTSYHVTGLTKQGDKLSITFRVQNDFDRAVAIKLGETTHSYVEVANAGVFEVTYSLAANTSIASGEHLDIVVTIEVVKTPATDITANFGFTFTAEVEPELGQ